MERSDILARIHEILDEVLPQYDPSGVTEDTLVVDISTEADSLTVNELILGLEEQFDIEIDQELVTNETRISNVIDLVKSGVDS